MTSDVMSSQKAKALRDPFPPSAIGKLPKPYRSDSERGNCRECGGYHGLPAAHLDYVGHAATTDRLLAVDPQWTWEPMATDERGLPALDHKNNLWIRLTVCGVTRIGVGDGKSAKECIGDAIRNAAMRFGVALDLWAKEDLHEIAQARQTSGPDGAPDVAPSVSEPATSGPESAPEDGVLLDPKSKLGVAMYAGISNDPGITEAERIDWVSQVIGRDITSTKQMLESEARTVLDVLKERKKA